MDWSGVLWVFSTKVDGEVTPFLFLVRTWFPFLRLPTIGAAGSGRVCDAKGAALGVSGSKPYFDALNAVALGLVNARHAFYDMLAENILVQGETDVMHTRAIAVLAISLMPGCVALQNGENVIEMADDLSRLRAVQVLQNVARAIDYPASVPSQVFLGTGQSTVTNSFAPTFKLPGFNLSQHSKELDLSDTDVWGAQWQFTAVTDAGDLRNLRRLYEAVVLRESSTTIPAPPPAPAPATPAPLPPPTAVGALPVRTGSEMLDRALGLTKPAEPNLLVGTPPSPETQLNAAKAEILAELQTERDAAKRDLLLKQLLTIQQVLQVIKPVEPKGSVVSFQAAKDIIIHGDSPECRFYQDQKQKGQYWESNEPSLGFNRWLYWKGPDGNWQPAEPSERKKEAAVTYGPYGRYTIIVTSLACFSDFVILTQGVTPAASDVSAQGPKVTLTAPVGGAP